MAGATGGLVARPLSGTSSGFMCICSSQSRLFGIGSTSRGQSLQRIGYRRATVAVVRACSAESGGDARQDAVRASNGGMERRQLLLASTAAAAAGLVLPAQAEPVLAPDLNKCVPATDERLLDLEGIKSVQCCPPYPGAKIKDFVCPSPLPVKVRKRAHLLSDKEKATYNKAYAAIQALPAGDPRSFTSQANVHCSYCNFGFVQQDGVTPLQVHECWLFFPFHRWYLYFHERILAKFGNDPTFGIPYWEWDNQDTVTPLPNTMPAMFLDPKYPALNKGIRNPDNYPPALVDFNKGGAAAQSDPTNLRLQNTASLYQSLLSGAKTPSLFFGKPYRAGSTKEPGGGSVENSPHGPVHLFVGGKGGAGEDMGNFYSAGRDPMFYCHHSNVNRMWAVWKTLPGRRRTDFKDPDYLNSSFLFYDENAELVRVKVGACLDYTNLGYRYEETSNKWKDYVPTSVTTDTAGTQAAAPVVAGKGQRSRGLDDGTGPSRRFRRLEDLTEFGSKKREIDNNDGFAFKLPRPNRPRRRGTKPGEDDDEEQEEILVIQGVCVPSSSPTAFDVFINLPGADKTTPRSSPNYVGTYYNVPHTQPGSETNKTTDFRMGVGDTIRLLGITDVSNISVTLVPKGSKVPITIEKATIEYE